MKHIVHLVRAGELKITFGDTQGTTLGSSISISEILMLIPKVMPQVSNGIPYIERHTYEASVG